MARPLFEQYKDALRRGHVALLGDELDAALDAYHEAASLVPDRPLPHASLGEVLGRLGRTAEAIAEYDLALALTPDDAIVAEARALLFETLPTPAAPDASEVEPVVAEAMPAFEDVAAFEDVEAMGRPGADAAVARAPTDARDASDAADADASDAGDAAPRASEPRPEADAVGSAGDATADADPNGPWPAIDLPSPPAPVLEAPLPDPLRLAAEAAARLADGDAAAARDLWLTAVAVHRADGRLDAAIDACLELLAFAPGDPRVHLAIANLQLDRGWDEVATEKIELLLRLTSLSGDAQAEADVHLLAAERLRDESPTRLDARRRGLPAG